MRGSNKLRARELRRSQTDAERMLWHHLRGRRLGGHKFRRQHSIGRFFVDFACIEQQIIVELDGGQHAGQLHYDDNRTRYLQRHGWHVVRFWDNDVLNQTEAVLESILNAMRTTPHPNPLPASGARESAAAPLPANGAMESDAVPSSPAQEGGNHGATGMRW